MNMSEEITLHSVFSWVDWGLCDEADATEILCSRISPTAPPNYPLLPRLLAAVRLHAARSPEVAAWARGRAEAGLEV